MMNEKYLIRAKESGDVIERCKTVDEACDMLTYYVCQDEMDEEDFDYGNDIYKASEIRERCLGFYELYNAETERRVNIGWNLNDNCVNAGSEFEQNTNKEERQIRRSFFAVLQVVLNKIPLLRILL